ncbi:hypothetical protein, partial [Enterobacter ludwigii]|uniref:hypothetical protein n=1 Tax=Enterobacter ludwigii TaxID=299767 RepID=UPI002ACA5884
LAGAQQPPWRSGARRPDSNADREPKGARSGIQVFSEDLLIGFQSRQPHRTAPHHATPRHATPRHATPRHAGPYP